MKRIIHLIPYDGTGGVEVAARSMSGLQCQDLDFSVQHIYPHVPGYQERQATFGVRPLLQAASRLSAQRPDLLIVSLWRACIVGALVKLRRPSTRLVVMLHSTQHAHWLDKTFTTIAAALANEWWGDSAATVNERLPSPTGKKKRVISFVTRRLAASRGKELAPTFLFWGRISAIKGIDRAILLFSRLLASAPAARFTIIGPDGGALESLRRMVDDLGLQRSITFCDQMDMDEISRIAATHCFYLQASKYEGMAMSVVEAMQLGLVPVVTPVGEIRNYCRDSENAILIHSDARAESELQRVLSDERLYAQMRRNAVATWQDTAVYADSMIEACRAALTSGSGYVGG